MRPADAANLRRLAFALIQYVIIKFAAGWISGCVSGSFSSFRFSASDTETNIWQDSVLVPRVRFSESNAGVNEKLCKEQNILRTSTTTTCALAS